MPQSVRSRIISRSNSSTLAEGRATDAIDTPGTEGASNLWFAGPGLQRLYVTDGDKLYRRPVKRHGAPEF
jgi:sugar lactone lactonase YvrE